MKYFWVFPQNFDIYLLDDIFATVDYKVAKDLYHKCLLGALKDKTRIVCTHHLNFLRHADCILVMQDGSILKQGNISRTIFHSLLNDRF